MPPGNKSQKLQLRYVYDITVVVDFSSNHACCCYLQILGRWDSQVYQTYVQSADLERREWEEVRGYEDDPICQNFNILGQLAAS